MTNSMINPQPNYSGVTIQISNPAVYADGSGAYFRQGNINPVNPNSNVVNSSVPQQVAVPSENNYVTNPQPAVLPQAAYPPQYYLNNYNYQNNGLGGKRNFADDANTLDGMNQQIDPMKNSDVDNIAEQQNFVRKQYSVPEGAQDFTKSNAVIDDLNARAMAEEEAKKNTYQKRVVALTDEYIKSLENYLNNPNDEIRLMASKEILVRLDEDKDRYDDAALNALLNKMMQDPSKLIRVAALSAFSSGLASGNNYTVQLLHNIQQNPNADKEDVLQAADILLKMSADTEVKNIPNPSGKPEPSTVATVANDTQQQEVVEAN